MRQLGVLGMPSFESRVVRLNDTGVPRFRVEFIGDNGDSVSVDCASPQAEGDEPSREQIVAEARRIARSLDEPDAAGGDASRTAAEPTPGGLMRPVEQTEARTHTSDGRDRGTE
jgi:hypothetical protein